MGGLGIGLEIREGERVVSEVEGGVDDRGVSRGGVGGKRKRGVSDLSGGGDDDTASDEPQKDADGQQNDTNSTPAQNTPALASLHKRRANASPEKFNKGRFESPPLQPPKKRARIENKLEVFYDETGTPRFTTSQPPTSGLASATTGARSTSSGSNSSLSSADLSALLLNTSRSTAFPRSGKAFSLIHSLCHDNDLPLHFVSYLTIPSLISLYAISKPFHYLFNRHPTAFILSNMRTWAPNADTIFPWRCYQSLCMKDPAKRQKRRLQGKEAEVKKAWDDLRDVPSLKWLQMAVWREGVSKDCLIQLAVHGLRCPPGTHDAVKRMWFLMDLPLNAHRIALIQTNAYISTQVLHNLTCFFLKIDMQFTDPEPGSFPMNHPNQFKYPNKFGGTSASGVPLRKMLLAERQLTPLWRVLRGWNWDPSQPRVALTRMDMLRLWVRHKFRYPEGTSEKIRRMKIMDVPWWEVGCVGMERTGVSFHNLAPRKERTDGAEAEDPENDANVQIALTHPSIVGGGLTDTQTEQILRQRELLYPHKKRIILTHEKPREPLLRPDELVVKESVRRRLFMHKKWVHMMLYGVCDEGGYTLPIWTEEELLRMQKGLPPRVKVKKQGVGSGDDAGLGDGDGGKGQEKQKGEETPASAKWSTLPPKGSI